MSTTDLTDRRRPHRRGVLPDAAVAVVLAALSLLPLGVPGVELGELARHPSGRVVVVLVLAQTAPLVLRRRRPGVVLTLVGVAFGVAQATGADTGVAGLGLFVAIYSAAALQPTRRRWTLGVGASLYVVLAVVLAARGSPERVFDYVTFGVVLLLPAVLGLVVRDRVAGQQERERLAAEQAVRSARTALARDLHDVVTHHVTAMVVQAESTAFGRVETDDDVRALTSIGSTGRDALRELRVLLDALDPSTASDGRRPAGDLRHLVDRLADAGYAVTLEGDDPADLPPQTAALVHDVAREALTNAMKHAPREPVRCELRRRGPEVELLVVNRTQQAAGPPGRGLTGMADRLRAFGGTLSAAAGEGGTFVVVARVPDVPPGGARP